MVFLFVIWRQPCGATSIFDGFIYSEDGSTKMGVVKEQFARVTKRKSICAENIDPDNQKKTASDQRRQTEKVQNVLEHFAGDDIATRQIF